MRRMKLAPITALFKHTAALALLFVLWVLAYGCHMGSNRAATSELSSFNQPQIRLSPSNPTSTPPAQKHVPTMAYLLGYKGSTVSPSVAAPYLTWAANPSES